ncbi:hypothetical protein M409DRAFT_53267 [Zasmidium cellare ATCC 36951]|uniref:Uncharacterized protein n=1 Tax=Zasmidium cellare ATCC 36951 TaxID=1080233 RepID=A0A6A6CPN0_ZASCE|nr:uncharacterized protein M409DRAFT_53267 [Zasmidium cellare ATCC 36951]KAF2168623.1 hypothetical protein M409DRAFT_53267 [Zasmidium cellare ATCC 36951]
MSCNDQGRIRGFVAASPKSLERPVPLSRRKCVLPLVLQASKTESSTDTSGRLHSPAFSGSDSLRLLSHTTPKPWIPTPSLRTCLGGVSAALHAYLNLTPNVDRTDTVDRSPGVSGRPHVFIYSGSDESLFLHRGIAIHGPVKACGRNSVLSSRCNVPISWTSGRAVVRRWEGGDVYFDFMSGFEGWSLDVADGIEAGVKGWMQMA